MFFLFSHLSFKVENQALETQGYKSGVRSRNLNIRQRAALKRNNGQQLRTTKNSTHEDQEGPVPIKLGPSKVLGAVENLPGQISRTIRAQARIIKIEEVKNKIKIVDFKKGRRLPPPASANKRDQILCNKCKKIYIKKDN